MKLDEWLDDCERSGAWLARSLDVSPQSVSAWRRGESEPRLGTALRIVALSGGVVELGSLVTRGADDHDLA